MVSMTAHRLNGAKMIGYSDTGTICVWYGGYGFNVYETGGWEEVEHFASGELAGGQDTEEARRQIAALRMEMDGFTVVE